MNFSFFLILSQSRNQIKDSGKIFCCHSFLLILESGDICRLTSLSIYLGHKSCRRQRIAIHEFHERDLRSTETGKPGLFTIYVIFYFSAKITQMIISVMIT